MAPTSAKYRLIDMKIEGGIDAFVASRRADSSWSEIRDAIEQLTGERVNRETLRLWFADRIEVTTTVRVA